MKAALCGCALSVFALSAQAQTFTVLHTFTGGNDGALPSAGVTLDAAGNVYGTASAGGSPGGNCGAQGCGTVFRLKRTGSAWVLNPLYTFTGGNDGSYPAARVIFGPDGSLYGTAELGGYQGDGTVFNLRPQSTACKAALCPWTETTLWKFMGTPEGGDGCLPGLGDLLFDSAGHIYGTASLCGAYRSGAVFELVKQPSGNWTETLPYSFGQYLVQGQIPYAGVIFDGAGNMYTTTYWGGANGDGAVVQLTNSPSGWVETDLHSFTDGIDGGFPTAGLIFDRQGNLYGTAWVGGSGGYGTVFELTPSGGSWTFNVIYNGGGQYGGSLTIDSAGNLYGAGGLGAHGHGAVYKLTPSNGTWTYTSLHDFTGGSDGGGPNGQVTFDAEGNLYGTAGRGGNLSDCNGFGCGVVWEITP
jgi:uncharacterized repeat protein (TIGR03803 family)